MSCWCFKPHLELCLMLRKSQLSKHIGDKLLQLQLPQMVPPRISTTHACMQQIHRWDIFPHNFEDPSPASLITSSDQSFHEVPTNQEEEEEKKMKDLRKRKMQQFLTCSCQPWWLLSMTAAPKLRAGLTPAPVMGSSPKCTTKMANPIGKGARICTWIQCNLRHVLMMSRWSLSITFLMPLALWLSLLVQNDSKNYFFGLLLVQND